jgi:hypothetical protein
MFIKNYFVKRQLIIIGLFLAVFLLLGIGQAANARVTNISSGSVPFTAQAPLGQWGDIRQQDGCEEATTAMAMAWVGNEKNITKDNWRLRILILSTFEYKKYGEYRDVSLSDMVAWLFQDYFHYKSVAVKPVESAADIITELEQGSIVLLPMDGQLLNNPHYTAPGPTRHMILIKGYDFATQEFITNDPGTRYGENYRYSATVIFNAIRDYQTGYEEPFGPLQKDMIVVSKTAVK